jgi:mycothiol synthase
VTEPAAGEIRPFDPADLPACLALTLEGRSPTEAEVAEARAVDAAWAADRYARIRFVAVAAEGIAGWVEATHSPWQYHPDKYWLRLAVAPEQRRRGTGSLLLHRLLSELRLREASLARTVTHDGETACGPFLAAHGFREAWRSISSRLDLDNFDPAPFATIDARIAGQGVTITSLDKEMAQRHDVLPDLYELYVASQADQPQLDPLTPVDFEQFLASNIYAPGVLREAWFLARLAPQDGARIVGVTNLEHFDDDGATVEVGYTGVIPAYRGRGIALALKLRAIRHAIDHGYREMHTDSNAVNERMLALNRALGFRPVAARITYELPLE